MNDFTPQRVHIGETGSAEFLQEILTSHQVKKIFLVTGKKSFKISGAKDWLQPNLQQKKVIHFTEFSENPKTEELERGIILYKEMAPDLILAIGGGSAMDTAKSIGFFAHTEINPATYLKTGGMKNEKMQTLKPSPFLMVAVPTTAGTGSEATHFAVLYLNGKKYSLAEDSLFPPYVILNPHFTSSLSPYLTACTGMDALAQAIESLWAKGATKESRSYAKKAIKLAIEYLEPAVNTGSGNSREKMIQAAYWAGRAINISKTTLCHALSYYMTSHYNYPHGHAVALFLPTGFEEHIKRSVLSPSFLQQLPENPTDYLKNLTQQLGLVPRHNFTEKEIATIASRVNSDRMKNNPIAFSQTELQALVKSSLIPAKVSPKKRKR